MGNFAYYSRVSNSTVLARAGRQSLSSRLRRQQLTLFGELARRSDDDPVRACVFVPGGVAPRLLQNLKRGRPRKSWCSEVYREAVKVAGSSESMCELLGSTARAKRKWRAAVNQYANNL